MSKKTGEKQKISAVKNKKSSKAKTTNAPRTGITARDDKVQKILVENFVSLQKVMTNLSTKFDNLSNQISKLLELFEISAKTLAQKDFDSKFEKKDEELIKKIDTLLDQNKVIARGLIMLHEPDIPIVEPKPIPLQRMPPLIPKQNIPSQNIPVQPRQEVNFSSQQKQQMIPFQNKPEEPVNEDSSAIDIRGYQKSVLLKEPSSSQLGSTRSKKISPPKEFKDF